MAQRKRIEGLIRKYFQNQAIQLRAKSNSVLATHSGLRGGHREEAFRKFLENFLPRRYSVGRGMAVDFVGHTSHEADVVVWDDLNFPRIPEEGHSLFFAPSVKAVIEVKSRWSVTEWVDIQNKTYDLRRLTTFAEDALAHRLIHHEHRLYALESGDTYEGLLVSPPPIAMAAVFLEGGASSDLASFQRYADDADNRFPDIVLLLKPGIVLEKTDSEPEQPGEYQEGWVNYYRDPDDALLIFTLSLWGNIATRSLETEGRLMITEAYDYEGSNEGFAYRFTYPRANSRPFFQQGE